MRVGIEYEHPWPDQAELGRERVVHAFAIRIKVCDPLLLAESPERLDGGRELRVAKRHVTSSCNKDLFRIEHARCACGVKLLNGKRCGEVVRHREIDSRGHDLP